MEKLAVAIASGFGSGYLPTAPGTWGTGVACLIASLLLAIPLNFHNPVLISLTLFFIVSGYWAVKNLPENWIHDDPKIVVDEIIGLFITLLWIPVSIQNILLAFFLFRIIDITKPLGIRYFDKLDNNWSVIVDDIIAGVYANVSLRLIFIILTLI